MGGPLRIGNASGFYGDRFTGTVAELNAGAGQQVEAGAVLAVIEGPPA